MVRRKHNKNQKEKEIASYYVEKENKNWLTDACFRENLRPSQVINKRIKEMREKNILW